MENHKLVNKNLMKNQVYFNHLNRIIDLLTIIKT